MILPTKTTSGKNDSKDKLVLGTAQLGMAYGVANTLGKPDARIAFEILRTSYESGARTLDTAQQYGDAEDLIGTYLRQVPEHPFGVISKISPKINPLDRSAVVESVKQSRAKIGKGLVGMLVHEPSWLGNWDNGVGAALRECVERGYITSYGVSLYQPEEFNRALSLDRIGLMQIPLNVLDRRFLQAGLVGQAHGIKMRLFVRSVFLQGLLLMPIREALRKVPAAEPYLAPWHELCRRLSREPGEVALQYVASVVPEDFIIVGCESSHQIRKNRKWLSARLPKSVIDEINGWPIPPTEVIIPSLWARS